MNRCELRLEPLPLELESCRSDCERMAIKRLTKTQRKIGNEYWRKVDIIIISYLDSFRISRVNNDRLVVFGVRNQVGIVVVHHRDGQDGQI